MLFGGIANIGTFDVNQIHSMKGHPLIMSGLIIPSFAIINLQHFVRSQSDQNLQKLILLSRLLDFKKDEEQEFIKIFTQCCTFVSSWDDPIITDQTTRVIGTHHGCDIVLRFFIWRLQQRNPNITITTTLADDEECSSSNLDEWRIASESTVSNLNRSNDIYEPEVLQFYPNALFQMTTIEAKKWNTKQLTLAIDVPSQKDLNDHVPIKMLLAPTEVQTLPVSFSKELLLASGWKYITVKGQTSRQITMKNWLLAKRTQYPLTSAVVSTIH